MLTTLTTSIVASLGAFLSIATPGGTAADYQRAASMPREIRGLVLNERVDPIWADGDALFRLETSADTWRFVRIGLDDGDRTDAFDHDHASSTIAEILGKDVDPDRLPIRLFASEGVVHAQIEGGPLARFEGDRLVPVDEDDAVEIDDPRLLSPVPDRRSANRGPETEIHFINESSEPVQVFWLDGGGSKRPYATLQPGGRHRQHTYAGHVWRVETATGTSRGSYRARALPGVVRVTDDSREAARPRRERGPREGRGGPNVFVRDHDLYLRDGEEEVRLTTDGSSEDHYTSRVTWSPDRTRLVAVRTTPAQEHLIHMIDTAPDDQIQPRLISQQYLKPGDEIAHPRPVLIDVASRTVTALDDTLFPTPWSISNVTWASDGTGFWFLYNQRGHRVMRLLHVDASTGSVTAPINEEPGTFFDYAGKLHLTILPDSNEAIWMSERSGWNHLYHVDLSTGAATPITSGEWVVRSVDEVDVESRTIEFRALGIHEGEDPYHVHFGRVGFDGSAPTWLTEGDGTHTLTEGPAGAVYLDTYSRVDLPPVHELRRTSDGSLIAEVVRADWSPLLETGWRPPERFVTTGRDGTTPIHGVIFTPSTFDEDASYPVIENIYAGPHGHFVPKSFSTWHGSRSMSELGFVLVRIDGMGTNWRSKAFHDVAWKNLGDSGFPDRIRWITEAASTRPWMDLDRVGIYGGSAGGQSSLRAMLAHGDFYHAAVSDCGCHDNRMDKIWWNELWMSWPIGDHYDEQSNVTNAHRLQGNLMLVVGELDRNVDPASTMQVVDALIRANKDFDLLLIPGAGHGAAESPYGRRRRADFFVRHLLDVEPRR